MPVSDGIPRKSQPETLELEKQVKLEYLGGRPMSKRSSTCQEEFQFREIKLLLQDPATVSVLHEV